MEGVGGAAADNGPYTAEVRQFQAVQREGHYQSTSKHWAIMILGNWEFLGTDFGATDVSGPPPVADRCPPTNGCYFYDPNDPCYCILTPIVIDVSGDGYALTSVEDGVSFDLDGNGIVDRTAWTSAGSDDVFLAFDRNGNGRIDDGKELFGNGTPAYPSRSTPTAVNGFQALRFAESPEYSASVVDGKIDRSDGIFARLLFWRDANHNGVSEPDELISASAAGLVSISTEYSEKKRRDQYGNQFRQRADAIMLDERGRQVKRRVWDIWFANR